MDTITEWLKEVVEEQFDVDEWIRNQQPIFDAFFQ